jgi:EAL and modified HD-GYP domain-containing signal transduction protein
MSTPALSVEPFSRARATYVARQPILDSNRKVFGYELLYRAGAEDVACTASPDMASASVLSDALLNIGFETLTDGRKGFMNVTRSLLLNDGGSLAPRGQSVLELLETIEAEPAVIDQCRALKSAGHTLALDDFVPMSGAERLLPYVKIVKVDVLATAPETRARVAQRLLPRGITMLAEKVETAEMYEEALADGYSLFQGYFFCKPKTLRAGPLPPSRLAHLQVLAAVNQPDVTVTMVEEVVKREASLSYKLLRCVNSAAAGIHQEIHSIRQAILLLGMDRIRTWASVWAMAGINGRNTTEVVTIAVLRARCCELLCKVLGEDTGQELFLLGLCSLLDAMLGQPLANVVPGLPLSKETRGALLGQDNQARRVLDAVIMQERGAWERAEEAAFRAGLSGADLAVAHAEALRWGHTITQSGIAAPGN